MRIVLRGYHRDEVDTFLARCVASGAVLSELAHIAGAGEPVTAAEVDGVRFSTVFRGYDMRAVDDLLDRVADHLRH